jgi:nicotinamide mononucleotide adenylyltransferase
MTKTVLVTGATGLLGRQVAAAFQQEGWNVVGTGFTRAKPPSIIKLDLEDAAEIRRVVDDVKYGKNHHPFLFLLTLSLPLLHLGPQ